MNVFFFYVFLTLFLILCLILIFSVLIQEAKSLGLGASFGGDSGDSLFGTSTAEVLKKFTAYVSAFFLIGCLLLSFWSGSLGRKSNSKMMPPVTQEQEIEK
jgi:preprotein translocase subunit SecG